MSSPSLPRSVLKVVHPPRRTRSSDFSATQLGGPELQDAMDPFISIDHFEMRAPTFAPHPHAGFSAVTYLFEDSEVGFLNRDSLGHQLVIEPGELLWTQTGRGVVHEEYPVRRGSTVHGLQMFVNLASDKKFSEPSIFHTKGPSIPVIEGPGSRARVLVGSSNGRTAELRPPTDVTLLDVTLQAGGGFEHVQPTSDSLLVYVTAGTVLAGREDRRLDAGDVAVLGPDGDRLILRGTETPARLIVFGGRPLREPIVSQGPFVMNTQEQIERAVQDYQAGRMGRLEPVN
ncbi:pirin family protein [Hyalangium rubrum]|uniref:Pirin-like C-terminal cupin domain-containing protein n=1 Tax=Hyalangium rubrum TaxID=3103134 RepID=A0ABU5HA62_9BACT|nr:pirin-like C-terminal cupin domain-containing protein [Hyalangium sp. s54d21]MDY7230363.1 pirin-like C-terminal cupin domain-containing protein [Hyalangium sp. s54d21]